MAKRAPRKKKAEHAAPVPLAHDVRANVAEILANLRHPTHFETSARSEEERWEALQKRESEARARHNRAIFVANHERRMQRLREHETDDDAFGPQTAAPLPPAPQHVDPPMPEPVPASFGREVLWPALKVVASDIYRGVRDAGHTLVRDLYVGARDGGHALTRDLYVATRRGLERLGERVASRAVGHRTETQLRRLDRQYGPRVARAATVEVLHRTLPSRREDVPAYAAEDANPWLQRAAADSVEDLHGHFARGEHGSGRPTAAHVRAFYSLHR